ncbi:hypothetical protein [Streptomyces hawaiiensis]|jgi:excinuclease ABC subunit A|nr:hypothetical protein [Streptomyces hawaiiensis]
MAHDEATRARGTDAAHPPLAIRVHGAKVHNLKNVDVTVPLRQLVVP